MIKITEILEYYAEDGLAFNQLMELYSAGRIRLQGGYVSPSDVKVICSECDLDALEFTRIRSENPMVDEWSSDVEKLYSKAKRLAWEKSDLDRRFAKAKARNSDVAEIDALVVDARDNWLNLADVYEEIYGFDIEESDYVRYAARFRGIAAELCTTPSNIEEKRKSADNLLRLGNLEYMINKSCRVNYLEKASQLYTEILGTIRNEESRAKSEENAKLGLVNLLFFKVTNVRRYLAAAERLLKSYQQHDSKSKYADAVLEIDSMKKECSK
jgi:hypothetical protein